MIALLSRGVRLAHTFSLLRWEERVALGRLTMQQSSQNLKSSSRTRTPVHL